MCYEGFYACKRSAKSQTLKVHPVASKTLTQKRPVYAAPERLVGDFSFSIVFFLGTVMCPYPNGPIRGAVTLRPRSRYVKSVDWSKLTNPRTSSHTHTQSFLRFPLPETAGRGEAVSQCVSTHTNSQPGCGCVCSGWVSLCLAVSQTATGLTGRGGQELQQAV